MGGVSRASGTLFAVARLAASLVRQTRRAAPTPSERIAPLGPDYLRGLSRHGRNAPPVKAVRTGARQRNSGTGNERVAPRASSRPATAFARLGNVWVGDDPTRRNRMVPTRISPLPLFLFLFSLPPRAPLQPCHRPRPSDGWTRSANLGLRRPEQPVVHAPKLESKRRAGERGQSPLPRHLPHLPQSRLKPERRLPQHRLGRGDLRAGVHERLDAHRGHRRPRPGIAHPADVQRGAQSRRQPDLDRHRRKPGGNGFGFLRLHHPDQGRRRLPHPLRKQRRPTGAPHGGRRHGGRRPNPRRLDT